MNNKNDFHRSEKKRLKILNRKNAKKFRLGMFKKMSLKHLCGAQEQRKKKGHRPH